jgi:hypothetical protein
MPQEVAKPLGLTPFVQEAMKQKMTLHRGIGALHDKIRMEEEIRETAHPVGFFGVQPVILPRAPNFSDSFRHDTRTLGGKLKVMLEQSTPTLAQSFWHWDASTDASSNDSESNTELQCEDELDEAEDEVKSQYDDEVKSQYDDEVKSQYDDEVNSQYDEAKAALIKQIAANDPNSQRVAAMEAVHQPIPGAKSGREEASVHEYLSYGKALMSDLFRKSSSNEKE